MQVALVAVAALYPALAARAHPAKVTTVAQVVQVTWLAVVVAALVLLVELLSITLAALVVGVQHLA
jgi:hypothetical protein